MTPKDPPLTPKPDVHPTATGTCDHRYQFLRQETYNEGYPRNPHWVAYDVYYCTRCLGRQQVSIRSDYAEFTGPRNESRRF